MALPQLPESCKPCKGKKSSQNVILIGSLAPDSPCWDIISSLIANGDMVYAIPVTSRTGYKPPSSSFQYSINSDVDRQLRGHELTIGEPCDIISEDISPAFAQALQLFQVVHSIIVWVDYGLDHGLLRERVLTRDQNPVRPSQKTKTEAESPTHPPADLISNDQDRVLHGDSRKKYEVPTKLDCAKNELELRAMFEHNLYPLFHIVQIAYKYLSQSNADMACTDETAHLAITPKFVSIASQLPYQGAPDCAAYSSSRWAVIGLLASAAFEAHERGVRTSSVDLGLIYPKRGSSESKGLAYLTSEVLHCEAPPIRIPFGTETNKVVRKRIRGIVEEIEDWKYLFE